MRRLPNLNAVRAFEAAARHGSFAGAAAELSVSHAAVSRHVRNLERELGVELFLRSPRHVELSVEGRQFAQVAAESLSALAVGSAGLRRASRRSTVILEIDSELGQLWLLPRLTAARLEALDLQLDLRVRSEPPRTLTGDVDLAITWGTAAYPGYRGQPFLDYRAVPVCAPRLLAQGPAPDDPDFYRHHRLIHERGLYWWERFLKTLGVRVEAAPDHLFFNRSYLCLAAAEAGLGLAIGDDLTCQEALLAGRLVRLPGQPLPSRERYYLQVPDSRVLAPGVRRLRDWLVAEGKASDERARQLLG